MRVLDPAGDDWLVGRRLSPRRGPGARPDGIEPDLESAALQLGLAAGLHALAGLWFALRDLAALARGPRPHTWTIDVRRADRPHDVLYAEQVVGRRAAGTRVRALAQTLETGASCPLSFGSDVDAK